MSYKHGVFNQDPSNTAAHGMGSHEEARYRYADVDPELLQDPFQVAKQAAEQREADAARERAHQASLGFIAVEPMIAE